MKYRQEIDGLRAIAVVPVVFFHAGSELFSGGFVGVDVFFVISGYLITTIIYSDLNAGTFSILNFYERRARRILPALFAVMAFCAPFSWYLMVHSDFERFVKSILSVLFFVSNVFFWRQSGYFSADSEESPLLHTWSLAVEEQYYLFFPLILLVLFRFRKRTVVLVLLTFSLVSIGLSEWGWRNYTTANFYLAPSRAWELLAGSLSAIYLFERRTQPKSSLLSVVGFIMILAAIFIYDAGTPFPSLFTLLPVVGVVLVILYGTEGTLIAKLLSLRVFVFLGLISYSTYLWHQPLFAFSRIYMGHDPSWMLKSILIIVSVLLGYLSWKFIEAPFRKRTARFFRTQKQAFLGFTMVAVAILSVCTVTLSKNSFLNLRASNDQIALLESAVSSPMRDECHTSGTFYRHPEQACSYFEGKKSWAVFGDSHGVELAYSLAELLRERNEGLIHLTFSACVPMYAAGLDETPCARWTKQSIEMLSSKPSVKVVVVVYRIHGALFGQHEHFYPDLPNLYTDEEREAVWHSLENIMETLRQSGKQVVLVLQPPELRNKVENLIFKDTGKNIWGIEIDWWNKRSEYVRDRIGRLSDKIIVVDPAKFFCDRQKCYATKSGKSLYFDDDHLSLYGAKMIGKKILEEIKNVD